MKYSVITLFPEVIENYCQSSIIGRAQQSGLITLNTINPREFTHNNYRTVDDTPYGGGSGMVLMCDPIFSAVESVENYTDSTIILTTPQGIPFNQSLARELSQKQQLIIICGHYEGYDERIRLGLKLLEISIGDFVMTGGELAALCIIDTTSRLIKGVLGKEDSVEEESFNDSLIEYPHYTRPPEYREMLVPEILMSGHHKNINIWRRQQAIMRTYHRRPDLLEKARLTDQEKQFLNDYVSSLEKEQ